MRTVIRKTRYDAKMTALAYARAEAWAKSPAGTKYEDVKAGQKAVKP